MNQVDYGKDPNICPFVRDPIEECFCAKWNSSSIIKALFYCRRSFAECSIYRRLTDQAGTHGATVAD